MKFQESASAFNEQPDLIRAVFNSDYDAVQKIIDVNGDVNCQDFDKMTALHAAAFMWESRIMQLLLNAKARVNAKDNHWLTPLHRACASGASSCVEVLLKHKAEVHMRDMNWQTPLHICAANNSLDCLNHLLPHVSTLTVSDRTGQTPLHHAARNGHIQMVKILCNKGANVAAYDKKDRRAIHWAAAYGHVDVLEYLLEHGSDVNWREKTRHTCLHIAAATGHVEVVRKLLSYGADLDAITEQGDTALHLSCLNGHGAVTDELVSAVKAKYLLSSGDEAVLNYLHLENFHGHTALHLAAASTGGESSMNCLLNEGANPHRKGNVDGRTALHMTAIHGRHNRAMSLLSRGCDINVTDKEGNTCLHIAVRRGHDIYVKVMLENGATSLLPGEMGMLPVHMAALHGHEGCLKLLLVASDVTNITDLLHAKDAFGRTVFHAAAAGDSCECMRLLLATASLANTQNNRGSKKFKRENNDDDNGDDDDDDDGVDDDSIHCFTSKSDAGKTLKDDNLLSIQVDLHHFHDQDINGRTPLHWAASLQRTNIAQIILLLKGIKVDACDHANFTPLHYAVSGPTCDSRLVELLLLAGANPCALTQEINLWPDAPGGMSCKECLQPLHLAANGGHLPAVNLLMKLMTAKQLHGVLLDCGISPIHMAAYQGHCDTLTAFLQTVLDCRDVRDTLSRTPLHLASYKGHTRVCFILLEFEADLQLQDGIYRWTALHYAASQGHIDCVDILLKALGSDIVDVDLLDEHKRTPLMLAIQNGHAEAGEILLKRGANVNARDSYGRSSLHRSAANGHEHCVEMLLKQKKINVTACDFRGRNALHLAATCGHVNTLSQVLTYEDQLMINTTNGVHVDAADDHQSQRRLKRPYSARVRPQRHVTDRDGFTPLHFAAYNGHDSCVELLMQHPVYCLLKGNSFSPLHCSLINGNDACTELLMANLELMLEMPLMNNNPSNATQTSSFLSSSSSSSTATTSPTAVQRNSNALSQQQQVFSSEEICRNKRKLLHSVSELMDSQGRSPLHAAAFCEQYSGLELYLRWVISVTLSALGEPMSTDQAANNRDSISSILSHKDSNNEGNEEEEALCRIVNHTDNRGRTALMWSARYGRDMAIQVLTNLVTNWLDWRVVDDVGQTALHAATEAPDDSAGLALLENLPDIHADIINICDYEGVSVAHLACQVGMPQYLDVLIQRGADVFVLDKLNRFPALFCAPNRSIEQCLRLCLATMFFGRQCGSSGGQQQHSLPLFSTSALNDMDSKTERLFNVLLGRPESATTFRLSKTDDLNASGSLKVDTDSCADVENPSRQSSESDLLY